MGCLATGASDLQCVRRLIFTNDKKCHKGVAKPTMIANIEQIWKLRLAVVGTIERERPEALIAIFFYPHSRKALSDARGVTP